MTLNSSTLSAKPWLTVGSKDFRLSLGVWVSCVCPYVYVDGREV